MDRILNTGCKWKLEGNIDLFNYLNSEYDSEQALDLALLALSDNIVQRNTIFQSVSPQQAVRQILEDIQKKITSTSEEITIVGEDPDDVERYFRIPGAIGTTRFLTTFNRPDGSGKPFVTPFNQKAWEIKHINDLIESGLSREEAQQITKNEIDTWPKLTELGTEVHKIFESIFKNESPVYKEEMFSKQVFEDLVRQIKQLKLDIENKYPNCDIYSELGIVSKELSQEILDQMGDKYNTISGIIDLLVVDKDGNAHLYDFKVSRKGLNLDNWTITDNKLLPDDEWKSTKKEGVKYQLSFYANMLRQYGINVVDTNIVPVKLDLQYVDPEHKATIKEVNAITLTPQKNGVEGTLSGKQNDLARGTLKRNTHTTSDELTRVSEIYSIFFPENSTLNKIRKIRSSVDYYKKQPMYVKQLSPSDPDYGKGKYRFTRVGLDNRRKYANTEEELNEIIETFIHDSGNKHSDFLENLSNRIEQVMAKSLLAEAVMDDLPKNRRNWAKAQVQRYFDDGWEFNMDPVMISIGLFMFTKNGKAEIMSIESDPLDTIMNLGKGKTILGKTKRDKFVNGRKIMTASNGNLALMKIMAYVANNQEKFKGLTITEVRAVNFNRQQEVSALNSKLLYNYDQLCLANPEAKSQQVKSKLFANDFDELVESANSRLRTIGFDVNGLVKPEEGESIINWLKTSMDALKERYDQLHRSPNFEDPVWQAYRYLEEAYLAAKGYSTTQESITGDYITRGLKLNGLMMSSLQYSPSSNLREFGSILQSYESEVAKLALQRAHKFRQLVQQVYKENGNGTQAFESWFERDANGLDPTFRLKDPDSPEFSGSKTNRECLREFLKVINSLRYPDYSEEQLEDLKASEEYYEVPLMEAIARRQLKARIEEKGLIKGIGQTISDKWKQYWNLTQSVFAEDEVDFTDKRKTEEENNVFGKLYNKFALVGPDRMPKIVEHGLGFFERNLEVVFNAAVVEFTKSEVSKEYIPVFQAIRLNLLHDQDKGVKNQDILKTFNKAVKSKFYNESIVESEALQYLQRWLNVVRKIFTTMSLSLNVTSFLRESLQGIYTGTSRALIKQLPGINEKNYVEALTYVIKESPKNFSSVSLLQQLNATYQMANQSLSQLANQRRVNWLNIKNWGRDTLFLTATAPDFMHRVSILVAKMMGDGCWEAHELVDGKLVYNFKKDKRFQHLINKETNHKDYLKEKSLYQKMLSDFQQSGYTKEDGSELKDGDNLPQAYTNTEAQSIKNYADLLYGHYDDSSRSLLVDTFLGSFIMQYKTYITAKFEQWTMPEGVYNTETLKQQFDPVTKEALYMVITEDEDGVHRDIVRESKLNELSEEQRKNALLYYDYDGIPMQGLLQETWQFTKDILSFDKEKWNKLWEDPTRRGYLYLALHDQFILALLMFLVTFLFGEGVEANHPLDPVEVGRKIKNMGPLTQIAYNVLQGSTMDAQFLGLSGQGGIIGNLATNPPMLTAVQRFAKTNWQMITGKSSLPYVASQNIGAIRSFQGVLKEFNSED